MRADPNRCLLLIDDEPAQRRLVTAIGARAGWWVRGASDFDAAREDARAIRRSPSSTRSCSITGFRARRAPRSSAESAPLRPDLPLLVLTAQNDVPVAVDAMRAGASDFLVKPLAPDRLLAALNTATDRRKASGELRPLSEKISKTLGFEEIVGSAPKFRAALAIAAKAARARVSVLIEGESGSGKEIIAQAIHAASPRGKKQLHIVNCGAIPANLVESVLFGHEKGAFTGAFDRHIGRFEDADGSTLFLDEVGELPLDTQVKLLRVARDRARSSGSAAASPRSSTSASSPRPTAASPRRSPPAASARISITGSTSSTCRSRRCATARATSPPLARHLLSRIAEQPGMRHLSITDDGLAVLMSYGWPGNVRQLQNALFRAAVLCESDALTAADFPHIANEAACGRRADDYHAKPLNGQSQHLGHGPRPRHHPLRRPTAICARSRRSRPTSSASPSAIIAAA